MDHLEKCADTQQGYKPRNIALCHVFILEKHGFTAHDYELFIIRQTT